MTHRCANISTLRSGCPRFLKATESSSLCGSFFKARGKHNYVKIVYNMTLKHIYLEKKKVGKSLGSNYVQDKHFTNIYV